MFLINLELTSLVHKKMLFWSIAGFVVILLVFGVLIRGFSFKLINVPNAISTVDTILRSIVVLFGIIVTILIISFQNFHKYFGRLAFKAFFKLTAIRALFNGLLLNILFYVLTYLKDCEKLGDFDIYAKVIFVPQIIASLVLVCSIFSTLISLLSSSQSRITMR